MSIAELSQILSLETEDAVTSVYNLLRESCGISQAEAADYVHQTRLDTVKSWSSDRRPAPGWAINQLQSLSRRIRSSGESYAETLKRDAKGNVFIVGIAHDDEDAQTCGFPSIAAQRQALAVAISRLPDDAEIRLVPRIRGAIPAPVLDREVPTPTETDRSVLMSMRFSGDRCLTVGAINRRKYERLESIGWIKGLSSGLSDVEYLLTKDGKAARKIRPGDHFKFPEDPTIYKALFVRGSSVTLVDTLTELRRSHAIAEDIDNCWVSSADSDNLGNSPR